MNNNEAYHLLSKKSLISASTYELIQAFEIPVSEFYNILREFSELAMISYFQGMEPAFNYYSPCLRSTIKNHG